MSTTTCETEPEEFNWTTKDLIKVTSDFTGSTAQEFFEHAKINGIDIDFKIAQNYIKGKS